MSAIEALYIFDEHNNSILEHVYTGRPPSAKVILPLYLAHPAPRPPLIYLPNTNPPSLVYSILQDRLLFLSPSSVDIEPLLVLEFLHRVADALENFLGSPLIASKIEGSYDVVAQLLGEMCDGGIVSNTEADALRDVVEAPSWMGKLLGGVGLPTSSPSLTASTGTSLSLPRTVLRPGSISNDTPAIPWRRTNVRHTSNELYVDIVETLSVTLAPSGRPLAAFANGTIAFTSKVSGVPDLLLVLSAPGGGKSSGVSGIQHALQLPVFHPCVRLARWRERPGELSFVPPDGRFVLAGYEADLLGPHYLERASADPKAAPDLRLPATVDVRTGLGPAGAEFEVRLMLDARFSSSASGASSSASSSSAAVSSLSSHSLPRPARTAAAFGSAAASATSASPSIGDVVVSVPVPAGVRNLADLRASRGEAHWAPGDGAVEWRVGWKDVAALMNAGAAGAGGVAATLRCTAVGAVADDGGEGMGGVGMEMGVAWEYDEDRAGGYQAASKNETTGSEQSDAKRVKQNAVLMPTSATVSFQVKGWLASGIKVERLVVDAQRSKGLGAGVTPYKGVKYLTVSRGGVEVRC